jgi:hypothetical protein
MRSLLITVTLIAAGIVLSGCPSVPGAQSSGGAALHFGGGAVGARQDEPAPAAVAPGEINWFQGSLDEAFARPPCPYSHAQLRGGSASRYNRGRLGL